MKRGLLIIIVILPLMPFCSKDENRFLEPDFVLKKWARSIERLDYKEYCRCESYPKTEEVFREMYKDYYITDILTLEIEEEDNNDSIDYQGNSFIRQRVLFEGKVVKRSNRKPYQHIRGDVIFIKFLDGIRLKEGWLISNRTFIRFDE